MTTTIHHRPVALGRIDYMNVAPIYYGLDNSLATPEINQESCQGIKLISGPPSALNQMMIDGRLDISPVSSAAYAGNFREWLILPDLAIACHERVLSVLLVSRKEIDALAGRRILITDESASARELCRLLFRHHSVRPEFIVGKVLNPSQFPEDIDAALVIGDSALSQQWGLFFPHVYDLGTWWWNMTALPFVFAVWAVRKEFARKYPQRVEAVQVLLNSSRRLGNKNMRQIAENACARLGIDESTAQLYYESLVYDLADREKEGLELFYKGLHQSGVTVEIAPLIFFENTIRKTDRQPPLFCMKPRPCGIKPETADCCPAI